MSFNFAVQKNSSPKPKPDAGHLGFGQYFTDHMFLMNYQVGRGWHSGRIVPYGPLPLEPSTMVLHYGQGVFEGLKAYKTADGRLQLFRPDKNIERLNRSDERLCIPFIEPELFLEAVKAMVRIDRDWIPERDGTALYIRPFVFATDTCLGVHPSKSYLFLIILSPVGAYYPQGMSPVNIYVETEYVRAVRGGVGCAKTIGNYAASLRAQEEASQKGYVQVLWLDGIERKYVEEVGSMNVFFKINGEVVTPALSGSILPGITRQSVLFLLKEWGIKASERRIAMEELAEAHAAGTLEEAFGTGTAAVISPMGELNWKDRKMVIHKGQTGALAGRLYQILTGIQTGQIPDPYGWTMTVD
jgi:branched-chain amino acid aminotransferase